MQDPVKNAQVRLNRISPAYWRVVMNNPPLNLMGPEFVLQFREIVAAIESDEQLRVVVFESAVEGFFLNHSDFNAKFEDLTRIPQGAHGSGSVAGHSGALAARARGVDCHDPGAGDWKRK